MTKMIAVTDEVYNMLARVKLPGESFTNLFKRRFTENKKTSLSQFIGCLSSEDADVFEEVVRDSRKAKWRDSSF